MREVVQEREWLLVVNQDVPRKVRTRVDAETYPLKLNTSSSRRVERSQSE